AVFQTKPLCVEMMDLSVRLGELLVQCRTTARHGPSGVMRKPSAGGEQKRVIRIRQLFRRSIIDHMKLSSTSSKPSLMQKERTRMFRRRTRPLDTASFEALMI